MYVSITLTRLDAISTATAITTYFTTVGKLPAYKPSSMILPVSILGSTPSTDESTIARNTSSSRSLYGAR